MLNIGTGEIRNKCLRMRGTERDFMCNIEAREERGMSPNVSFVSNDLDPLLLSILDGILMTIKNKKQKNAL